MTKKTRQPIVAVLGHVDHGKTTLLDAIRKTNLLRKEVGGITQAIGASVAKTKNGQPITFIDTPGHEAFNKMRSRGAQAADIAILVVAADDGVKPQTKEAIEHILTTETPFLVAITKTDIETANTEITKGQLEKEGVLLEGRGGKVPVVEVSGKTGKGLEELLEMIILLAEVEGIEDSSKKSLSAVVIETGKDKRGTVVSVVVKEGIVSVGAKLFVDGLEAKVRGLFDWEQKPVKVVGPGEPSLILGFSESPNVGSLVTEEKQVSSSNEIKTGRSVPEVGEEELGLVLKTASSGSLEAVIASLPKKAVVVSSGVGDVTESDVFMAKSSNANIYVFEAKVSAAVKKLAETEGVKIKDFRIIYELIDSLEETIKKGEKTILGEANILAEFPFNSKRVAGCKVAKGTITKEAKVTLVRDGKELGEAKIISMKKQKEEIASAKEGEECGLILAPQLDFEIGDVLVSMAQNG